MGRLVGELRRFFVERGVAGPGVAAVSGGADSVALLLGLLDAGITDLTVAHFNHRLRGTESDADEAFVRELAGRLGVRFVAGGADAAAAGGNTEATARRLRYDWLAGLGADWVATGHTADDQAETVLHRLIRGTGLDGLRGIAAERNLTPRPPSLRGKGEQGGDWSGQSVEPSGGGIAPLTPPSLSGKGAGGLGFDAPPGRRLPHRVVRGQPVADEKLYRAKHLRREMTPAEAALWAKLRRNQLDGWHFRRQQVIAGFIADFYCEAAGLVVEVDGTVHDAQPQYDVARDRLFAEQGLAVLRVRNEEVLGRIDHVLGQIADVCRGRVTGGGKPNPPAPFPTREGGASGEQVRAMAPGPGGAKSKPNPPAPFPTREGGASGRGGPDCASGRGQREHPACSPALLGKGPGVRFRGRRPAPTWSRSRRLRPRSPFPRREGGRGVRGFPPPTRLIRPLLTVTRADVLAYLHALDQPYRTDATNADRTLTRNRIRHELVPLLKSFNPQVVAALGQLAEQAEDEAAERDQTAVALLAAIELPRAGDLLVLDAAALLAAPQPRVRDALRRLWSREGWPAGGMTFAHWSRLAALTPGDYPGGVRLTRAGRVVQLGRRA
ncbi:MAG: tRNA lysidine(34) synthetase TilS [Gemmataceae bacterium]